MSGICKIIFEITDSKRLLIAIELLALPAPNAAGSCEVMEITDVDVRDCGEQLSFLHATLTGF